MDGSEQNDLNWTKMDKNRPHWTEWIKVDEMDKVDRIELKLTK